MCLTATLKMIGDADRSARLISRRAWGLWGVLGAMALLTLWPQAAVAQQGEVSMTTLVDNRTVQVGDTLEYTVLLETGGRQDVRFVLQPNFGTLRQVGSSRGTQFKATNQGMALTYTFNFGLEAVKPGTVTIKSPIARIGDKQVQGRDHKIKVVARGKLDPNAKKQTGPVSLEPVFSTLEPYVGQQIEVEYGMMVDDRQVGAFGAEVQDVKVPDFDGFWTEDLNQRVRVSAQRRKVVDGRRYTVRPLQVMAVFPLHVGEVEVEPMTMVGSISGRRTLRRRRIEVSSPTVKLKVRPLPAGAPKGFQKGNVGQYSFDVKADKIKVAVGEPLTVRLRVRGVGMIGRVELPKMPQSELYTLLEPVEDKKVDVRGRVVGGEKVAEVVLTPNKEGVLEIPALVMHTFDPEQGKYVSLSSRPIKVRVSGKAAAPPQKEVELIEREGTVPESVRVAEQPLSPLRPMPVIEPVEVSDTVYARPVFWGALLAPPVGYVLWLVLLGWRRRSLEDNPNRARRGAAKRGGALLDEASRLAEAGDAARASDKIKEALTDVLAAGLEVPPGSLSRNRLERLLGDKGVAKDTIKLVLDVRERCDSVRFAAGDGREAKALVIDAGKLLSDLKKVLG